MPIPRLLHSIRLLFAVCAVVLLFLSNAETATGQGSLFNRVHVRTGDGVSQTTNLPTTLSRDESIQFVLNEHQREGYLHAELDSFHVDTHGELSLFIDSGPLVTVSEIRFSDGPSLQVGDVQLATRLAPGRPLNLQRLEEGLQNLALDLARNGHVLGSIEISDIVLYGPSEQYADLELRFDPGPEAYVRAIELEGAERTRTRLVERILGHSPGRQLDRFDAIEIQRQLRQSGFFAQVGMPRLRLEYDSVVVVLPVTEEESGSFDVAMGYQPSETGSLVGSGHLDLQNAFGMGRSFLLNLDRLPGQTSRFEAAVNDPFFLGLPFSMSASYHGYQQDSLFHRQQFQIEVGYTIPSGPEVFISGSMERSRPGTAGIRLEGGRQRIARSDVASFGGGIRYMAVDYQRNPTRGLVVEAHAESGVNRRILNRLVDSDTTREERRLRLDRATVHVRFYQPVGARGVLVSGIDGHAIHGDEYDRSQYIRIGGLRSLRGYDDDQFLVRLGGRGITEFRYRIDRLSYLMAFLDLAYLERPTSHDIERLEVWRTGFGIGAQFDTGFSLMNVVLAANPTDGISSSRIHAGVSFGL